MAENLGKRPSKGILKTSSSFDNQEAPSRAQKETKWDEMNIIATLHPADKDYGHMKIEEPKTPYNFAGVVNEDSLDSCAVASKLAKNVKPKIFEESSEEEDEETPEEKERRKVFEAKRKGHYREWEAVQLARKKLQEEDDEDEDAEEKEKDDEEDDIETEQEDQEDEDLEELNKAKEKTQNKCVPLSEN
ncbi:protein phosphatase inhibitor 2 isoform X1 [Copidosoma floridanum]|uniref:protein phosphatase inhibitor 2 isoform X1 n=2 Tax=Copidosoma floridanum TaxID=29053 RepID=UPI0006C9DE13|nr:protein phosphatase inhibitor 2 isoform X1 [Copidosoma floridanum]XP_014208538.1 protein phosphatase inhibitor 2 isoform X1 [Copidosoma floridanum]